MPGVVSLGVDWITATAKAGFSEDGWDALCGRLLTGEHQDGNFARPWSMLGYEGIRCGPVFCGARHGGALVQVTGEFASHCWRDVVSFADSVPRIDLQATIRIPSDPYTYVRRVDQQLRRAKKRRGRGPKIAFQRSENGGATAYVGRKTSKRYGRVYNKHAESGLDAFERCIRWEAVFREDLGRRIALYMFNQPSWSNPIGAALSAYFQEVGCCPPSSIKAEQPELPADLLRSRANPSDASRKLAWLRGQVQPTIELLFRHGYSSEVLSSLGLLGVVQFCDRKEK